MGWVLRKSADRTNPTLPGGVYGDDNITAGRGVYWFYDGARIRFILFICDGGRYGMSTPREISYNGTALLTTEMKFHPGTLTKQISPKAIQSVNAGTDTINCNAHGLLNDDPVRFHARSGSLPGGIKSNKKYFVKNKTANDFQISETLGGSVLDITSAGSGTLTCWKGDAGFDDPVQGLPEFCPEVETTFSGICYVDGLIPAAFSENAEPVWENFRVIGFGRKLMNYDATGAEIGVTDDPDLRKNPSLCIADNLIVNYKKPLSRIDWASLALLKAVAPVLVHQRVDFTAMGTGAVGSYFNYVGTGIPDVNDGSLIVTSRDGMIDFDFGSNSPADGVSNIFFAVWEHQIIAKFSETYTFTVVGDNGVRLYLDGVLKIDRWTVTVGTDTCTFAFTADTPVTFRLEFFNNGGPGNISLKWQSASQPLEIVPRSAFYDLEAEVPRYEVNFASTSPNEASVVHEGLMLRCPGWDWTDKNGKITFLPPDRPVVYEFLFDAEDPDAKCTFLEKTFSKDRRHRRDRRNFSNYSFRNRLISGFPEEFVEVNRPSLRELIGGVPDNDAPDELQVMTRSLAQRIGDLDFVINFDPAHDLSLGSQKAAAVATKSQLVRVKNWVKGDRRVEDSFALVNTFRRQGNRVEFTLIPIEHPFYADEEVE